MSMSFLERVQNLSEAQRRLLSDALRSVSAKSPKLDAFVGCEDPNVTSDQLIDWLRGQVPSYMVPDRLVCLKELPRRPNGKLDLGTLHQALEPAPADARSVDRQPQTEIEQILATIWKDLLRVADVDVEDDFFEIGGDSIVGIQVLSLARQQGILLQPAHITEFPKLKDLAATASVIQTAEEVLQEHDTSLDQLYLFRLDGNGNTMLFAKVEYDAQGNCQVGEAEILSFAGKYTRETRLEELATDYIRMMRDIQAQGPYMLISMDCGAHVTYEVAQQLRRAGEDISFFGVVESAAPILSPSVFSKYLIKGINYLKRRDFKGLKAGVKLTRQRGVKLVPKKDADGQDLPFNHGLSINNYLPQPYDGAITIFQSRIYSQKPEGSETIAQWKALVREELEVKIVDGEYPLDIMAEQHIDELIACLPAPARSK